MLDYFFIGFLVSVAMSVFAVNLMKSILFLELVFCFLIYTSQMSMQLNFFLIILVVLGVTEACLAISLLVGMFRKGGVSF